MIQKIILYCGGRLGKTQNMNGVEIHDVENKDTADNQKILYLRI
ncbi:hypothetical protein NMA510612_0039 [Neisseria meningitidis]|uniref:Uncharacterized protein n=3 Tax=Neisseria meningitidis TaxID=487 RepID=A0A0H5QAQ9_NEIMI|nr:hypothetical protein NMA510612_0039 [Neisseria meningitidis]CBA08205.1 hypothetical protein NMO_1814 [Neisseria meningitidis alpha14]CRY98470.1 hypothetical protein [Neisseria meningitidis serogroup B]